MLWWLHVGIDDVMVQVEGLEQLLGKVQGELEAKTEDAALAAQVIRVSVALPAPA